MNISEIKTQLESLMETVKSLEAKEKKTKDIVKIVANYIDEHYFICNDKPYLDTSDYDDEITVRLEVDEYNIDVDDLIHHIQDELDELDDAEEEVVEEKASAEFVENPDE